MFAAKVPVSQLFLPTFTVNFRLADTPLQNLPLHLEIWLKMTPVIADSRYYGLRPEGVHYSETWLYTPMYAHCVLTCMYSIPSVSRHIPNVSLVNPNVSRLIRMYHPECILTLSRMYPDISRMHPDLSQMYSDFILNISYVFIHC